ncbi:hypothetical protein ABZ807_18020 [Micromonospora sp. NPDC047548]|uniref:hypothetical protein n=1 Tax=Micromonospora sp. NPDC047548 TaxID=3155624 RepID=UPI0033CD7B7D
MLRVTERYEPLRLYAQSRRIWTGAALTAVLCALLPFIGAFLVPVPSEGADGGVALVPAWRILAVAVAFGPVLSCHSPFGEMEAATGRNWRRTQAGVLTVNATVCALLFTATCWVLFGGSLAVLVLRGILGWLGISLLAGRLLSWKLAWVGPLAVLPLMIFWGFEQSGFRWWEFTARPIDDLRAWMLTTGLAAAGVAAYAASSWRWRALVSLLRGVRRPPAEAHRDPARDEELVPVERSSRLEGTGSHRRE